MIKPKYYILSKKEANILKAVANGLIPPGGEHFDLGADMLAHKWLPFTDYQLYRTPLLLRVAIKLAIHIINFLLPILFLKRFDKVTSLNTEECTKMLSGLEHSAFPLTLMLLLVKMLILPPFYQLDEVKKAIDYQERFQNKDYVGVKA